MNTKTNATSDTHQSFAVQAIIAIAKQATIKTLAVFPTTPPCNRTLDTFANQPEKSGKSAIQQRMLKTGAERSKLFACSKISITNQAQHQWHGVGWLSVLKLYGPPAGIIGNGRL
jgi:hypothetical protein